MLGIGSNGKIGEAIRKAVMGEHFTEYGEAATEQLLPSSLRDATSLNEGGIGKIRNSIILPKAPSPRELARREP